MNLTSAIRRLERQAAKAEKIAKAQQAKADSIREKLETIQKLMGVLGRATVTKSARRSRRGRKKMSAAGRARIATAQKKRWAAFHAKRKGQPTRKVARKAKRKLSAAGRARIIAAVKARWAREKAAQK